jgi:hypothetical protein
MPNPEDIARLLEQHPSKRRLPRQGVRYVVGLDLGQSVDPTAIAVGEVERVGGRPVVRIGYLERILGMEYPVLVAHVGHILSEPQNRDAELVLDYTGVGRPVADMFRGNRMRPICVSITAGNEAIDHGSGNWSVPKVTLVSGLQALLHANRFFVQQDIQDAGALVSELQSFGRARGWSIVPVRVISEWANTALPLTVPLGTSTSTTSMIRWCCATWYHC